MRTHPEGRAAAPRLAGRADPLEVFEARCSARAYLWSRAEIPDLHEAVDKLQADAVRDGLVAKLGQDRVQALIGRAFAAVREPCMAVEPEPAAVVPGAASEPTVLVAEPSQSREAAASTVEAVMYALRQHGAAALQSKRTRQRITELSSRQLEAVVVRLTRIRGSYPKITDDLLLALAELIDG